LGFPVKAQSLRADEILGSARRMQPFIGGPVFLVRLAPIDYHRVHYCDDGTTSDHERMGRRLWTVNQHALRSQPDILFENERSINILETRNFGRLGFVEVGAVGWTNRSGSSARRAFSSRRGKVPVVRSVCLV
jgi:phosphatidylserine decarboxylase